MAEKILVADLERLVRAKRQGANIAKYSAHLGKIGYVSTSKGG